MSFYSETTKLLSNKKLAEASHLLLEYLNSNNYHPNYTKLTLLKCIFLSLLFTVFYLKNTAYAQLISKDSLIKRDQQVNQLINTDIYKAYELAYSNYEILIEGDFPVKLQAEVYFTLSQIYNSLTEYPAAVKFGLEAVRLFIKTKSSNKIVTAYNNLGGIYYNTFDYDRSIYFTEKALRIAKKHKTNNQIPQLYNNLAGAYLKKNDLKEALLALNQAREYLPSASVDAQSSIHSTLSEIYFEKKAYDSAHAEINKAIEILKSENSNNKFLLSSHFAHTAKIHHALGQDNPALAAAKESYLLANRYGFILLEMEVSAILAELYTALNMPDSSKFYALNHQLLEKEIWNSNKERQMNKMVIKMREQELEDRIKEAQQQRILTAIVVAFLIILMVFLILLLILRRKKQRLYKTVIEQKNEIETKNKELEAYHLVKDKIFSTVVHDFKTPLNSLESILVLLENQQLNTEHLSMLSSKLKVNVANSKQSINNLILWAKNQMAGIQPNYGLIDIRKFIDQVKLYHHINLQEKKIDLEIKYPEQNYFHSDKEILFIAINNVISNAIKFSPISSSITLKMNVKMPHLIVEISDQGPGIEPEKITEIFSINTLSNKGSGIGLSLTKELLQKINAEINIESLGSVGTKVVFIIPHTNTR